MFNAEDTYQLKVGEIVSENVALSSRVIEIEGLVEGDVYCVGQHIRVSGHITGDLICAGQSIVVDGVVDGSVRTASQELDFGGMAGRNVTSVSQSMNFGRESEVAGEVAVAGQSVALKGQVDQKVLAAAEETSIEGNLLSDVYLFSDSIRVSGDGRVAGGLTYVSNRASDISEKSVAGAITHKIPEAEVHEKPQQSSSDMIQSAVGAMIWQLVVAIVLVRYAYDPLEKIQKSMAESRGSTLFRGFVAIVVGPIAGFILFITGVGAPIGIIVFLLYILSFFAGRTIVSLVAGNTILKRFMPQYAQDKFAVAGVGVISSVILFRLPYIGFFVAVGGMLYGIGGLYYLLIKPHDMTEKSPPPSVPGKLMA